MILYQLCQHPQLNTILFSPALSAFGKAWPTSFFCGVCQLILFRTLLVGAYASFFALDEAFTMRGITLINLIHRALISFCFMTLIPFFFIFYTYTISFFSLKYYNKEFTFLGVFSTFSRECKASGIIIFSLRLFAIFEKFRLLWCSGAMLFIDFYHFLQKKSFLKS